MKTTPSTPWRRRPWLALVVPLMLAVAPSSATPKDPIPDTAAGRRAAELLALTESGDESALRSYARESFTEGMQQRLPGDAGVVSFILDQHRRFGGFEVVATLADGDQGVTLLVHPANQPDRWLRYIVSVEAEPPHRLAGYFVMPASPGDIPATETPLSAEEAVRTFARAIDRSIENGELSGVVLLARGATPVLERAAGLADRDHGIPVTMDTVFGTASLGKMFTAVTVGRLVEAGHLHWRDTVGEHVRGWLPEDREDRVTLDLLLSHRGGLGDYLDLVETDAAIREARSLQDYRSLAVQSPIEDLDPSRMQYSNLGYVVVGAVLEAVTSRSFYDLVQAHVFSRCGMAATGYFEVDEVIPHRATGYLKPTKEGGNSLGGRSNTRLLGARGTPAGGVWSTAGDLLRFARALVEGRLVRPGTLDTLLEPRVRFPVGGSYGYGFVVHHLDDGTRTFGHSGGHHGVNAELKIYGDGAWTLVVLSNVSGGAGEIVGLWDGLVARVE